MQRGEIRLSDRVVSSPDVQVPPELRGVGMVFQDYALFPHLSVAGNVAFGLNRLSSRDADARTAAMLEMVGLSGVADVFPHEFQADSSSASRWRARLPRRPISCCWTNHSPTSTWNCASAFPKKSGRSSRPPAPRPSCVTHDQHEAFAIADEIGIMKDGSIEQWDSAYNLYHRPRTRFVADFVGQGVFLRGIAQGNGRMSTELGELEGEWPVEVPAGGAVDLLLRPDDIIHDDASPWQAEVAAKAFRGAEFLYTLRLASGTRLLSLVPSHHNHAIGERIGIRLEIDHVVAFPAEAARQAD